MDTGAYQARLSKAFADIERMLESGGFELADVVKLTTFHVFGSASFEGDKAAHMTAFRAAKDAFFKPPYPAWTAIGVSELLPQRGLVEIELVAQRAPR